ncbi:MAG: hypothetical protein RIR33_408 [Pseudomonadota bacterium]
MPASKSYAKLKKTFEQEREVREKFSQSIEGVRAAMDSFGGRFALAKDITVEHLNAGGVPAEWVAAQNSRSEVVILYIHGGCYVSGAPLTVRECCARIARAAAARVLSVDYRLAPEHPFPAPLDDVLSAYGWLLDQGYKAKSIVIAGESAGGGLTIAALMKIRDDGRLPMPALGVPISPWIDMTMQHETLERNVGRDIASVVPLHLGAKAYVGAGDPRGPYVSPLFGDLRGLPPLLIQVGGAEVLLDDGIAIAHKARREGVDVSFQVWPEMFHVWHWFGTELDEAREAIEEIGAFIKSKISTSD